MKGALILAFIESEGKKKSVACIFRSFTKHH